MRDILREDLKAALKNRNRAAANALRSALAAIDNAEAVAVDQPGVAGGGEHVAGSTVGLGSGEVERRQLSHAEVRAIVENEVLERTSAAEEYEQLGRADLAEGLRSAAVVLSQHLPAEK